MDKVAEHMDNEYDGIIIGAGHNGMVCAGYLAKAGLKILVVERHLEIGGGLDSHESPRAGFWHNVHSNMHRGVSDLMWYKDLGLAELGQEYIRFPITVAMLLRDHRAIVWHNDPEKTAASIARFSAKDGKTFLQINREYARMAREIFGQEQYAPPVPFEKKKAVLERSESGRLYLKWQPYSINETVSALFENDIVRGMFVFLSVIRGFETDCKGMGHIAIAAIGTGAQPQISKGSTHKMAHTLHKMVVKAGADLVEAGPVAKILMQGGKAVGVRTTDGREFRARKFVASSLNPNQTFLQMVGKENLDPAFAKKVEGFKYSNTTPLFTLHLALNEALRWKAADYDPEVNNSYYIICGLEGLRDVEELYQDCAARGLPRSLQLLGAQPAKHDPSQAPPGKCTAFFWQIAPGNLCEAEGGRERWDRIRGEFTDRCVKHLAHYVTNLDAANIVHKFGVTPVDIERHLPNMVGGDIQVGELNENQFLDKRPFPECSQYRTPVSGLYLCGSSAHPGGNITGAPGYNAAGVICSDLGMAPWWRPKDSAAEWEALAAKEAAGG
ncbi:MAG: NAD(P)/FAD-dependent oxidoreductase [Betaproteobacteria bacterium]|nr:NAD(P)/FAD-dependent oxidoreductase [Betaproteobacteria bacterium]